MKQIPNPYRFLKALWKWARGGYRLAPAPVVEFRWMVCQQCEHRRSGWFRWFCRLCGCTISKRRWPLNKGAFLHESCPINKWSEINE